MKQKFKDILKSKWGWTFAIIGFLFGFLIDIIPRSSFNQYAWGSFITTTIPLGDIKGALIFALVGFIIGLILQWLWRKIK